MYIFNKIFPRGVRVAQSLRLALLGVSLVAAVSTSAVTIPNAPLTVQPAAKAMVMLAMGRDHRLFYEAYNDASDIDGDGTLDIRFKPAITYLGLFDSNLCYTHNNGSTNADLFTPVGAASGALKTCSGQWSGNWLNYATTSRIDALRVVLYGGMRDTDSASQTVLRRAYIPQDAHSWAKEYTSVAVDKYDITSYTPLALPTTNRRHFFGNLTANSGTNCLTLDTCSNLPPLISTVLNSNKRVWEWASKERPVLDGSHGGTRTDRTVRVAVCTSTFNAGCKLYPTGAYKPVGTLHDFGENESLLFGLMTGSYDNNFAGGRLRKVVSSFKQEVDQANGQFISASAVIVNTINNLRIRDFNNGRTDQIYKNAIGNRAANEGEYVDWGNPVAELMYEAVRYFAGAGSATTEYNSRGTTIDTQVGLPIATWDNPYSSASTAKAPYCAKANILTISDTNTSYDSDQLPGVAFPSSFTGTLNSKRNIITGVTENLNVLTIANQISGVEGANVTGARFIGESIGTASDTAPTAKNVISLGSIRGLAPEEPTKQGGYYASSVAHYAKIHDLHTSLQGTQTVNNLFVALASPLPKIEAKLPNGKSINIVPFAKSVAGFSINNAKGSYQPTNQIVDFYVESIANSGSPTLATSTWADYDASINGGRYQAKFRINFEDVEQGNDHDMDAIVEYTVTANANNTLEVVLNPIYQAGGAFHRIGYVVSGSNRDGIYLVVQDESENPTTTPPTPDSQFNSRPYFLNVPPGRSPGYCEPIMPVPVLPARPYQDDCYRLPFLGAIAPSLPTTTGTTPSTSISIQTFTFSSTANAATFLKDPMWYAAKWGGFEETAPAVNGQPDLVSEWDKDGDGVPDAYFFVQNPTKLKDSLRNAFAAAAANATSASNVASNSGRIAGDTRIYQASFVPVDWTGNVLAFPITLSGIGAASVWRANEELPLWNSRKIYMNTSAGVVDTSATAYSSLPISDRTLLVNDDTYRYIRGDKSREVVNGGTLRNRASILGDIIHSSPTYEPESKNLYVGANDGMLHVFDGASGAEKFAFVPNQVIPRLKNLTAPNYSTNHEYFVDGDVQVGFKILESNSKKYIYSQLGRGGKGVFSIDPSTTIPTLTWEYTPIGGTTTGTITSAAISDNGLGLMISRPVMALLNNGKMGLLVGNGYNSTSGRAVLYIFILNPNGTLSEVRTIDTGVGGDNGLAGAAWADGDGNGTADYVYAGDLKGNVWKFDIRAASPAAWAVSFAGLPLFTAINAASQPQPITAPVSVRKDTATGSPTKDKVFVFFGTGSYFQSGDSGNTQIQSWYGITDDLTAAATPIVNRASLRERPIATTGSVAGQTVRVFATATAGDMLGRRGWYIDLNSAISPGERIVVRSQIIPAIVPALMVSSLYPVTDQCTAGGEGYLNFVSPFTGGRIELDLIDVNNDGLSNAADRLSGVSVSSIKLNVGVPTTPLFLGGGGAPTVGSIKRTDGSTLFTPAAGGGPEELRFCDGNSCCIGPNCLEPPLPPCTSGKTVTGGSSGIGSTGIACGGTIKGRLSWREIFRD